MACSASATTAGSRASASRSGTAPIPILKERLFGMSGKEGNHGEDVKELYWYLDATPTCSYARALYKYPQRRLPVRGAPRAVARGRQGRPRARDPRHRRLCRRPLLRRRRRVRQGRRQRLLVRVTVTNRGPSAAPHRRPSAAVVSQHVELGAGQPSTRRCSRSRARRACPWSRPAKRTWGRSGSTRRAPTSSSSPRTSRTRSGSGARRTARRT